MFSQTDSGHTDYIWACKLVGPVVVPFSWFYIVSMSLITRTVASYTSGTPTSCLL